MTNIETWVQIDGKTRRVSIEIDVDRLAYWLGMKAMDNKGCQSKAFYGALVVTVVP